MNPCENDFCVICIRLIVEIWGYLLLCQFQTTRLLPRLRAHKETEGEKNRDKEREREA